MKPAPSVVYGLALVVAAVVGPFGAIQVSPRLRELTWSAEYVVPLFAIQIIGFVFLSTGLLRLLSSGRYELYK